MKRWPLMLAMASVAVASSSAADQSADYTQIGGWKISAYYSDRHRAWNCTMFTGSKVNADNVTMAVNSDGYSFIYQNAGWSLPIGTSYQSRTVIGQRSWAGTAKVIDRNMVLMTYPLDQGFGEAFSNGSIMYVWVGNNSWNIDLNNSKAALSALGSCMDYYVGRENSVNPFGPPASRPVNPFD